MACVLVGWQCSGASLIIASLAPHSRHPSPCRCENCQNKTAPAAQLQPRMHVQEVGSSMVRRTRSRDASEALLATSGPGASHSEVR